MDRQQLGEKRHKKSILYIGWATTQILVSSVFSLIDLTEENNAINSLYTKFGALEFQGDNAIWIIPYDTTIERLNEKLSKKVVVDICL